MNIKTVMENKIENVSLVIPVLNEVDNVSILIDQILSLPQNTYNSKIDEITFIDDGSLDGTREKIKEYANKATNIKIRLLERDKKHGTVNAQLYGIAKCKNSTVIVMDGDLQHPVEYLARLIEKYMEGYDLILASRYVKGASVSRKAYHGVISRGATLAAKLMLPQARKLRDPISGFFILDRRLINTAMEPNGHNKLSLFILSGSEKVSVAEVPYHFMERANGESKVATGPFSYLFRYMDELRFYRRYSVVKNQKISGKFIDSNKKAAR